MPRRGKPSPKLIQKQMDHVQECNESCPPFFKKSHVGHQLIKPMITWAASWLTHRPHGQLGLQALGNLNFSPQGKIIWGGEGGGEEGGRGGEEGEGGGRHLPAFRARQVELGRLGGIALEAGHAVGVLGHARCAHRPALQRHCASSLQHREL